MMTNLRGVIGRHIASRWDCFRNHRSSFNRLWMESLLFRNGNHWIRWKESGSSGSGSFVKQRLDTGKQLPVTNYYRTRGDDLASVISRVEPTFLFMPASNDKDDLIASEATRKVMAVISEENDVSSLRARISPWLSFTGNVFLLSGISNGVGYTEIFSPFSVFADMTIDSMKDQSSVFLVCRKSRSWVYETYGINLPDDGSDAGGVLESCLSDLDRVAYLVPGQFNFGSDGYGYGSSGRNSKDLETVTRCFFMPFAVNDGGVEYAFPNGLYVVKVGERIVEVNGMIIDEGDSLKVGEDGVEYDVLERAVLYGGLPRDSSGKPFIPIVHMKFEERPGTFFGVSPLTEIIDKNRQINRLDARVDAIFATSFFSPLLIPDTVKIGDMPNYPGAVWRTSSLGPVYHEPKRLPGEQVPPAIIEWRRMLVNEIDVIVSSFSSFRGQAPFSGASGDVVDSLISQNRERFSSSFRMISNGWKDWATHQLDLFRGYGGDIEKVYKVLGNEGTSYAVDRFRAADISSGIDVRVEVQSTVPMSQEVENVRMIEAIKLGAIDLKDPISLRKFLKNMNLSDFAGGAHPVDDVGEVRVGGAGEAVVADADVVGGAALGGGHGFGLR